MASQKRKETKVPAENLNVESFQKGGDSVQAVEVKPATQQKQTGAKTTGIGVTELRVELQQIRGELQDFIREQLSLCEPPRRLSRGQTYLPPPGTILEEGQMVQSGVSLSSDLGTILEERSGSTQISMEEVEATVEVRKLRDDDAHDVQPLPEKRRLSQRKPSLLERNPLKRTTPTYPMPLFMKEEDDKLDEQREALLGGRCLETRDGIVMHVCHGGLCEPFFAWAKSQSFEFVVLGIILANALSLGIQTDYLASHCDQDMPEWVHVVNHGFSFCFVAELLVRACAYHSNGTFPTYLANNLVDSAAIIILAIEELLAMTLHYFHLGSCRVHHAFGILRMTRALRLIRILRSPRFLRITHQLRAFIISILDSVQAFLWAMFLIVVITYGFSVYITSQVAIYRKDHQGDHHPRLVRDFGNTFQTMKSLLVGMLNGTQWYDSAAPLGACDAWLVFVLAAYMAICLLGILNMVNGVFVTNAMKHVDRDKLAVLKIQLTDIFHKSDSDLSGTLTMQELDEHLENPELLNDLQEIDLRPEDARAIFHLLDIEGTGDIDIGEMVAAAVHLQGSARALDLELMKQRQENMHKLLSEALELLSSMCDGTVHLSA